MEFFAAIDVSLELSSVCVVDTTGQIVREAKVASEPEALVRLFQESGPTYTRIGLEAGPLSQWLHAGLTAAGFEVILLETRHVKAALGAMTMKTDRNDARGMAQMIRMGWFRPVHAKTVPAQEMRALLVARLTPRRCQSGEIDRSGHISKTGDGQVRTALFEAAHVMLLRVQRLSALKAWALRGPRTRGLRRAKVALARKLSVVLHRMWADGTEFRWGREVNEGV